MRRVVRVVGVVVGTLGTLSPSSLASQAVVGDVVDDGRQAVGGAVIGVFDVRGRLVAQGSSDDAGHFRINVPASGPHRLHITRLAYRSLTGGPYELRDGLELELFVVMHPAPVSLEGIDVAVAGRSARLEIAGFYERESEGFGYHFDREQLARRGSIDVAEFLARTVPGMRGSGGKRLVGLEAMQSDRVTFERGSRGCVPAMWVDGVLVRGGGSSSDPLRPDDWFDISEIEGIEFYSTVSGVPTEFASSAICGVLVVWTRGSGLESGAAARRSGT